MATAAVDMDIIKIGRAEMVEIIAAPMRLQPCRPRRLNVSTLPSLWIDVELRLALAHVVHRWLQLGAPTLSLFAYIVFIK